MEIEGTWAKDTEGYMEFSSPELQRLYEAVTDSYHKVYNSYSEAEDDEDEAYYKALGDGYEMTTDYQTIHGKQEFATTYRTPKYVVEVWYSHSNGGRKAYDRGFIRISSR